MTTDVVIVAAARRPVGTLDRALAAMPAHDLGAIAIRAAIAPGVVDEVILGQVLTAGQRQNPARQAAIKAGLAHDTTAWGVNQVCGSGLQAVALGLQQIMTRDTRIVVAGGQENTTLAQYAA